MPRNVAYRRTCSDAVSWRQDQSQEATIYILRNMGPTGFLLKEEGEPKYLKVYLGDPHTCTCSVYRKEKDLCKHICWVILKKFRVPRTNPVTWQLGLVEREINEILRGVLVKQDPAPSSAARKYARLAGEAAEENGKGLITQRDISDDDVCPICQEELLKKKQPVTYCKFGCGNSVHIKCMKVWAEHQKSSGKTEIECPFCRVDFGPWELLKQEFVNSSAKDIRADRLCQHLGVTCRRCHVCPVVGKCYRCTVCAEYHLCQTCFSSTDTHKQHSFEFRQKPSQRWRPAQRGTGAALPQAVVTNLMNREITDHDYDLLLQLDSQAANQASDLSEETVKSFPLEKVRTNSLLLAPGQQCRICLRGYQEGQLVRKLPCRHKFHTDCIDNWLLHQHATCPIDGSVISNESVRQMREAARTRQRRQQDRQQVVEREQTSGLALEIPGVGYVQHQSQRRPSSLPSSGGRRQRLIQSEPLALHTRDPSSLSLGGRSIGTIPNSDTRSSPGGSTHESLSDQAGHSHVTEAESAVNNTPSSSHLIASPATYHDNTRPPRPSPHRDRQALAGLVVGIEESINSGGRDQGSRTDTSDTAQNGRLARGRNLYRDIRTGSTVRQRSRSSDRVTHRPQQPRALYIGNDPTSISGYTSEYTTTANTSGHLRKLNRIPLRRGSTERPSRQIQPRDVDDLALAGNALNGLTLNDLMR